MIRRVTLEDIWNELEKGAITEAILRDPTMHMDGYCDFGSQRVYVNPQPSIVETLMHELIHRRWPRWGERRVDKEAKRLLGKLSDAEVTKLYNEYKKRARKRKRPVVIAEA